MGPGPPSLACAELPLLAAAAFAWTPQKLPEHRDRYPSRLVPFNSPRLHFQTIGPIDTGHGVYRRHSQEIVHNLPQGASQGVLEKPQLLQAGTQAMTVSPRGAHRPCFCPGMYGSSLGPGTMRGLNTTGCVDILVTILYTAAFSESPATPTMCLSFLICRLVHGGLCKVKMRFVKGFIDSRWEYDLLTCAPWNKENFDLVDSPPLFSFPPSSPPKREVSICQLGFKLFL